MEFKFKNVYRLLLTLLAISSSSVIYADNNVAAADGKEWREVFRMDFGGDSESDPGMSTIKPSRDEMITQLDFLDSYKGPAVTSGRYFIAKSTQDIKSSKGNAVADNTWVTGGDHTYPESTKKGYCMMFDCNTDDDQFKVFEKSLKVDCRGVNFKFSCWFANLSADPSTACQVSIGIYAPDDLEHALSGGVPEVLEMSFDGNISWVRKECVFKVPENATYSEVLFLIYPPNNNVSPGWDFAIDDILIEVEQPILAIENDVDYSYKKPVNLIAKYENSDITSFFGNDFSNVKYRWEYSTSKNGPWSTVASGAYKSGSNMAYKIDEFEKEKNNGWYRLTVGSGSSLDNGFCSIQQKFQIDEQQDKCYLTICQDSSKTILGHTIKSSDGLAVAGSYYKKLDKGSIVFFINEYKYTKLAPEYDETCQNSTYPTLGDIFLKTKYEYAKAEDGTECISTMKDMYKRVIASPMLPTADICVGQKDALGEEYSKVDETGTKIIKVPKDGCIYEQVVLVHPTYNETPDTIVCKGEMFQGQKRDTPGKFKGNKVVYKSEYGCDSVVVHNIIVPEIPMPPVIEKDPICQKDAQGKEQVVEFGGKIYREPMDKIVYDTIPSEITGCDSISSAHIIIYPSGEVGPFDTLICRDQILFGEEFKVPGDFTRKLQGKNAYGCVIDTIWRIQVVEVQLKLRVAFLGDNPVICQGTPLDLNVTLLPPDAKFRWEPAIGTNSFRPTLWPEKTTTYTAYADLDLPSDIYGDAAGCHAKAEVKVEVHPQPVLTIDSVDVDNRNVEYSIEGGTKPYTINMDTKVIEETTENYGMLEKQPYGSHTLQVVDSIGCTSEAPFSIEAKPLEPVAFFSPNGDGENDLWRIGNIDVYPTARIRIFDRLGRVLYDCKGYENDNGFDGTYNGHKLPATDYWYEIDVEELDKQYVGHFTLLR